jgi:hypothetical protein
MDRCLGYLSSPNATPQLTSRCINLILQLFNVFQSGQLTSSSSLVTQKKSGHFKNQALIAFKVSVQTEGIKVVEFKESETTTMEQWKRKVAE